MIEISVIISTYNPDANRLNQTLAGLQQQTLPVSNWELIIVNNNSTHPIPANLSWHPHSCIVTEDRQGLTYARLKGFATAKANILIMVDDDNILDEAYLQNTLDIFKKEISLGGIGGKSEPLFENTPPTWLNEFYGSLALRNLGDDILISQWENKYPDCAPIGAGMCIRKPALANYMAGVNRSNNVITDRTGDGLSSGGDNDMVLEILKSGWKVGYFPSLKLRHIIPQKRMEAAYLARLAYQSNASWVKLLDSHGINPWKKIAPWTLPIREIKSWFTFKAYSNKANYIQWKGYCGMLNGLANV